MFFLYIILRFIYYYTHVTFVVQTIKFTTILLVYSFSDTARLKRMPLPFQMNIDKDHSKSGMNLDDDVVYNFTNANSQLMKMMVLHLGEAREKNIHCSSNV